MPTVKRRYVVSGVNQSLLELALKLRAAEVRVNGRTLQSTVPPHNISAGISSTVDGGRFQFIARGNRVLENFAPSEYINSGTTDSVLEVETVRRFCADDEPDAVQDEIESVSVNTYSNKLSLPNRIGPSLWPFLSSIKASADIEHVKYLEKNQQLYSNYGKSEIAGDYVEPLSEGDFKIIIDSAIDAVLQTRESNIVHLSRSSRNESSASLASAASAPVSVAPLSMNTGIDGPMFEIDSITSMPTQPAVVSKRYAAAVANPRRFQCGLCPYSTNNRSHVRRHHISVHSDARPYRCYVCGKEFARCENAKVHMVSRHPDVPYDVDRLRNNVFFNQNNSLPPTPTNMDSAPSTSTQSPNTPCSQPAFQLQQDIGGSGISTQWPSDPLDTELKRVQLEHHAVPPWLNFPKIEPKPEQNLPVFGHGNTANHLMEGIPCGMFQAQANTVMNIQSVLGSFTPIKQEVTSLADTNPVSDHQICLYCQVVCQNATELAKHIATNHSALNPALHAAPNPNPGYVVLQTAAPIFLFPYGSDAMLQNRRLGYHPILPKLPIFADESRNQNETLAEQHSSSVAAGTSQSQGSAQNVPSAKAASTGCSSTSMIALSTPDRAQELQATSTPASSEGKRERKRQFKTFYCSRCPDRAPFRYEKSFEKHLKQHRFEDRSRKAQKIASKVA